MVNFLEHAIEQITPLTLENLDNGDEICLNSRFNLYKYFEMDYYVLFDKKINEEGFCVQFNSESKNGIIVTDFYGYPKNEKYD